MAMAAALLSSQALAPAPTAAALAPVTSYPFNGILVPVLHHYQLLTITILASIWLANNHADSFDSSPFSLRSGFLNSNGSEFGYQFFKKKASIKGFFVGLLMTSGTIVVLVLKDHQLSLIAHTVLQVSRCCCCCLHRSLLHFVPCPALLHCKLLFSSCLPLSDLTLSYESLTRDPLVLCLSPAPSLSAYKCRPDAGRRSSCRHIRAPLTSCMPAIVFPSVLPLASCQTRLHLSRHLSFSCYFLLLSNPSPLCPLCLPSQTFPLSSLYCCCC